MVSKLIIDTDTAVDDALAILLAALSDTVDIKALTIVAGNVEFENEVENAKYTLNLAGVADDVPVYEGARRPLLKESESISQVHGEGGLGGEINPDTNIPSAEGHAVDAIVDTARNSPGEVSLACIGPLTNIAHAIHREPELNNLLNEVVVMGGAVNTLGNQTPAAEFNFWADPDAAKIVIRELDVTLVDWGLSWRQAVLRGKELNRFADVDTLFADFFTAITRHIRRFTEEQQGVDAIALPDPLALACLVHPELVTEAETYFVDIDERKGITRGFSLVDELGITDGEPRTHVVESINEHLFKQMVSDMLLYGNPERSL